jgi:hypothetical protein
MSKYSFDVNKQTVPASDYVFAGNQKNVAEQNSVIRVFTFRCIRGNVSILPNYIKKSIENAGFEPVYLGGTTYSHSVIGLKAKN